MYYCTIIDCIMKIMYHSRSCYWKIFQPSISEEYEGDSIAQCLQILKILDV